LVSFGQLFNKEEGVAENIRQEVNRKAQEICKALLEATKAGKLSWRLSERGNCFDFKEIFFSAKLKEGVFVYVDDKWPHGRITIAFDESAKTRTGGRIDDRIDIVGDSANILIAAIKDFLGIEWRMKIIPRRNDIAVNKDETLIEWLIKGNDFLELLGRLEA